MSGRRGGPKVVALGGGHGLAVTLQAARCYAGQLTAVVSVADDGGSSGRLRQAMELDLQAPGDARRCLVALADQNSLWARAFEYRFPNGEMRGHALGNLVLAGLAETAGDFVSALEAAAELLGVQGRVLPATAVPVVLKASVDGHDVIGQVNVGNAVGRIDRVSLVPVDAPAPQQAIDAILEADQVVIGPGSLFTSVLAVCAVGDIRAALQQREGGRVYVCNLRPQAGETDRMSARDHLAALRDHGIPIDTMLVDPGASLPVGEGDYASARSDEWVETVTVATARADGLVHDPERLAAALASVGRPSNLS